MARLPLVSPLDRALFLKAQPYLEGLSSNAVAALAQYTGESFFARRQSVYVRGVPPRTIHFLASGRVRVRYPSGTFDIEAPAGIGLVEYLVQSPEPPAAWALEDTLALCVDADTFMQIVEDDFVLYMSIARTLARATRAAAEGPLPGRPPEHGFSRRHTTLAASSDLVHRLVAAREAPFFRDSNVTVLTGLLRFQPVRDLAPGEALYQRGAAVESMALLLEGSVTTETEEGGVVEPPGAMLGGWELLAGQPRSDTVRATTAARVVEIDRSLFTDVLEDHPEFAIDYLRKLSARVLELRLRSAASRGELAS